MDPVGGNIAALPLVLGLVGLGIALSMCAVTASGVTWWLSRAGKLRAYEHTMNDALTNALRRLETVEQTTTAAKVTVEGIADEAAELLKRSRKERQRVRKENWDAENRDPAKGPVDMSQLTREEQLRLVREGFNGGRG